MKGQGAPGLGCLEVVAFKLEVKRKGGSHKDLYKECSRRSRADPKQ